MNSFYQNRLSNHWLSSESLSFVTSATSFSPCACELSLANVHHRNEFGTFFMSTLERPPPRRQLLFLLLFLRLRLYDRHLERPTTTTKGHRSSLTTRSKTITLLSRHLPLKKSTTKATTKTTTKTTTIRRRRLITCNLLPHWHHIVYGVYSFAFLVCEIAKVKKGESEKKREWKKKLVLLAKKIRKREV